MAANPHDTTVELREHFRTLDLSATASYDATAFARLSEHAVEDHRRKHGSDSAHLIVPVDHDDDGSLARHTWRVCWVPPSHWREELIWPGGQTTVIIIRPDSALSYVSNVSEHGTMYTSAQPSGTPRHDHEYSAQSDRRRGFLHRRSEERRQQKVDLTRLPTLAERVATFPLLHPSLPESQWKLHTLGEVAHRGHMVRQVHATRRANVVLSDEAKPTGYWPGIDEYEFFIDDALQILLRLTGLVGGTPVGDISADEVRVNAPVPDDTFFFAPPPGTRVVHLASLP